MIEIERNTVVINVNRRNVDANTKSRREGLTRPDLPVMRVQRGKAGKPVYGDTVAIYDAAGNEVGRVIYRADGAIVSCGARCVIVAHHGAAVIEDEAPIRRVT